MCVIHTPSLHACFLAASLWRCLPAVGYVVYFWKTSHKFTATNNLNHHKEIRLNWTSRAASVEEDAISAPRSRISCKGSFTTFNQAAFGYRRQVALWGEAGNICLTGSYKQPALFVWNSLLQTVKNLHRVFGFNQIFRHGKSHVPEADKPNFGGRWAINYESLYIHSQPRKHKYFARLREQKHNPSDIFRTSFLPARW